MNKTKNSLKLKKNGFWKSLNVYIIGQSLYDAIFSQTYHLVLY